MCNPPSPPMATSQANSSPTLAKPPNKPLNPHAMPYLKGSRTLHPTLLPSESVILHQPIYIQQQQQPPPESFVMVQPFPAVAPAVGYYPGCYYRPPVMAAGEYPTVKACYNAWTRNFVWHPVDFLAEKLVYYNPNTQPSAGNNGTYDDRRGASKPLEEQEKGTSDVVDSGFRPFRSSRVNRVGYWRKRRPFIPRLVRSRMESRKLVWKAMGEPSKRVPRRGVPGANKHKTERVCGGDGLRPNPPPVVGGKTSLMIRNIPNQLKREDLMGLLDQHCRVENTQDLERSDCFRSEYDFLYLPVDFGRRANLGYAFVNFTNAVGASRFRKAFNNYRWEVSENKKICKMTYAVIQGKHALRDHFKNSLFPCDTDDYLPVVLTPPRDGFIASRITIVGRRVGA